MTPLVRVERHCHVCKAPIEEDIAYTRTQTDPDGRHRIYTHPSCFFEHVPEPDKRAYVREHLPSQTPRTDGSAHALAEPEPPKRPEPTSTPTPAPENADVDEAVIHVEDLAKTYPDGTQAVKGARFTVFRGEIFGILGPNGAGKTTLIGMLGTLVKPTSGTGHVGGVDVREDPSDLKPRLGFAMQEVGVDELATGREFLHLQARLYGLSKDQARQRANRLLSLFDLDDAADKRIESYSGGMKRRIDLAGALIHEPDIIFLDEPTEGLDPRGRREMWNLVQRLNHELDATILLSTHYMEEADALCDRLAIMDQGEIVVEGTPSRLKAAVGEQSLVLEYDPMQEPRIDEAATLLAEDPLVEATRRSHLDLYAYVDDTARATPRVLRALESQNLAPASLRIQQATLDDVYLAYTGRSIEQAEALEEADTNPDEGRRQVRA